MLDQTITDTPRALDICPKCELSISDDARSVLAYCFICRRGDMDSGRAIPRAILGEGEHVHRLQSHME